jgi:hypothetical protein
MYKKTGVTTLLQMQEILKQFLDLTSTGQQRASYYKTYIIIVIIYLATISRTVLLQDCSGHPGIQPDECNL